MEAIMDSNESFPRCVGPSAWWWYISQAEHGRVAQITAILAEPLTQECNNAGLVESDERQHERVFFYERLAKHQFFFLAIITAASAARCSGSMVITLLPRFIQRRKLGLSNNVIATTAKNAQSPQQNISSFTIILSLFCMVMLLMSSLMVKNFRLGKKYNKWGLIFRR